MSLLVTFVPACIQVILTASGIYQTEAQLHLYGIPIFLEPLLSLVKKKKHN